MRFIESYGNGYNTIVVSIKNGILYIVANLYHVWKLQISFRKRATIFRALLQKETRKEKASFGAVTHTWCLIISWFIHVCAVTHSCVCAVTHSYVCVPWLIHVYDMTHSCVWHDTFMCLTQLIYMCDMTRSYVWHDPFICVPWLIHMCDMTHSYVWHDSFICVTWLIHMCDVTRL